ncbi:hypothetical protein U1Q18_026668 [Sarracenia purpurea var. burkii]
MGGSAKARECKGRVYHAQYRIGDRRQKEAICGKKEEIEDCRDKLNKKESEHGTPDSTTPGLGGLPPLDWEEYRGN